MTNDPRRPAPRGPRVGLGLLCWFALAGLVPQARSEPPASARQVTIFGIMATPDGAAIDPKLKSIAPQLRKLLPNHGFKLLDVKTKRLVAGQAVACDLLPGYTATSILMEPLDDNGKVQLRCEVQHNQMPQFATTVATPPNQLFFCDRRLPNGTRLLIGVGAR